MATPAAAARESTRSSLLRSGLFGQSTCCFAWHFYVERHDKQHAPAREQSLCTHTHVCIALVRNCQCHAFLIEQEKGPNHNGRHKNRRIVISDKSRASLDKTNRYGYERLTIRLLIQVADETARLYVKAHWLYISITWLISSTRRFAMPHYSNEDAGQWNHTPASSLLLLTLPCDCLGSVRLGNVVVFWKKTMVCRCLAYRGCQCLQRQQ